MTKKKALMSWSSGKDSAWALHKLQQNPQIEVVGLFCTVNAQFNRVAMHGVRVELLLQQAESIGLPLELIELPYPCSNEAYESIMGRFVKKAKDDNIDYFAFGDLFLEDIRNYRVEKLRGSGIEPIFPLWGLPTDMLAREMVNSGLKTLITCIDPQKTPRNHIGREFNVDFLESLPESIDPCGENGEFHSYVHDGPMFKFPVQVSIGETVDRDNFVFADVLPARSGPEHNVS